MIFDTDHGCLPHTSTNNFAFLVKPFVHERNNARVLSRFAFSGFDNGCYGIDRIAGKNWVWKSDITETEVRDGCSKCCVLNADTNNKSESKNRVDQRSSEFSFRTIVSIDMNLGRVVGCRAEPAVIGLGNGFPHLMFKDVIDV